MFSSWRWILLPTLLICGMASSLDDDRWQLVWQDDFDQSGNAVDNTSWNFDLGDGCDKGICGWGNKEEQLYTNSSENVYVSNGHLVIQAIKKKNSKPAQYTSARLVSKKNWKYGKIQIRAKFPSPTGLLANIWLLPTYNRYGGWPGSGELDIVVMKDSAKNGREIYTNVIYGTIYPDFEYNTIYKSAENEMPAYSEDFHLFELLWEKDKLQWFVDGKKLREVSSQTLLGEYIYPFNERFHLVISLAVGGGLGGNSEKTSFPKRLKIDYIKVYQIL